MSGLRSAWDLEWEARMWRSARDVELRTIADFAKAFTPAARKIGIAFEEVARRMSVAMKALERASISLQDVQR